jgi:hypothetical protein
MGPFPWVRGFETKIEIDSNASAGWWQASRGARHRRDKGAGEMSDKIVSLENRDAVLQKDLERLLQIVPSRHQQDGDLRRLIAFRLKIDGFTPTRSYIVRKIREMNACGFSGRMFDYLKDDQAEKNCRSQKPGFSDNIP